MVKKRTGTDPSPDPSDSAPTQPEENLAEDDENSDILEYLRLASWLTHPSYVHPIVSL